MSELSFPNYAVLCATGNTEDAAVMSRALSYLFCIGDQEKVWAEGENDGDDVVASKAGYRSVGDNDVNAKRICVPQKIDPKTFFANERTFLKWLTISVMLGLMSVTLLNFANTNNDGAELAGIIMLPVSIAFMIYALVMFRYRARCIYMREPMRYDDTKGPTVLVAVLASAMIISTGLSLQRAYSKIPSPIH